MKAKQGSLFPKKKQAPFSIAALEAALEAGFAPGPDAGEGKPGGSRPPPAAARQTRFGGGNPTTRNPSHGIALGWK